MERSIWKFPIRVTDVQDVTMPAGASILRVDVWNGEMCLWAEVFPDNTPAPRRIRMFGTGHPLHDDRRYIGTVLDSRPWTEGRSSPFVWHVYEGEPV